MRSLRAGAGTIADLATLAVLATIAVLVFSVGSRAAVAQKTVTLPKHEVEFSEPFTLLGGLRELKDGRVVVSDSRDKTLQLIDFKAGSAAKIGREGQGPGEYSFAGRLIALPGDTTAMYDLLNSRYLLIGPDGKAGKDFRLEEETGSEGGRAGPGGAAGRGGVDDAGRGGRGGRAGGGPGGPGGFGGGMRIGGAQPKGTDGRGRIYYEGSSLKMTAEGIPAPSDSAPIMRYDRGTKRADTVAWAHLPATVVKASGSANNRNVMISQNPFGLRDDWAVFADGRVAVARAADYHVDFYAPTGGTRSTTPVKFERLAFTEADKQEYRDSRKNAVGMTVSNENGKVTRSAGPMRETAPDPEWPQYKTPFPNNAVWARPNGELWIARTLKAGDKVPTFNVFDAQGKLLGVVALAPRTKLVGFGAQTLYAVRVDADDLQYLQRYRLRESPIAP